MYKPLLALALLSYSLPSLTQKPPAQPPTKTTDSVASFTDEAAVVERDDVVYRYASNGTGSKLETAVFRVQSNAALQTLAVLSFPYASGSQHLDIVYARVRKPDGTVVETPGSDVQDQPAQVTQIAPTYSDIHLKQIPIRSLTVGDKLEFQTRMTQNQPEIPGEFWGQETFGAEIVFLERSIELHVPKEKHVTVYSPAHPPTLSEVGNERVYSWKGSQLRPTSAKNDDGLPQDNKPPIAWTTFPDWEAVGLWYQGLIAGRDAVTPAIQARADELTTNAKTDTDKVRALYEYVSTHNHYIGIDFGVGRYQPHYAAEIMTNQYGDCKDKHTLLAALLRAKGFKVSAVLIGAGIEMNEKVPMPYAFNHVITRVEVGGEPIWLDATTEVAPYRVLLAMLRGKQALVIPSTGNPEQRKTPAELPFSSVMHYEANSVLDKAGSFKGHIDVSLRGDDEVLMRAASRQIARAQWDQFSQNYSNVYFPDGTTSATALDPAEDTSGPWHLRYDYAQSPYGQWEHYLIGALLPNPILMIPTIDEKKPPKKEIELNGPRTVSARSTIHLPQGYGADLPDATHLKTAFATYDKTYQVKDGSLIGEFKLEMLTAKLPEDNWKFYKKFLDDLGTEPWIQLTSIDHVAGEKGPPPVGENNASAARLVNQVHEAIVAKDYDLARKLSDDALAVNDKQAYLWSQRGFLAGMRRDLAEAATDYERELKQHPEEVGQYPGYIFAENRAGRKAEEREWLEAYRKIAPEKDTSTLFIGGRFFALNDMDKAIEIYRAGCKAYPDNKRIQMQLANALFSTNKPDEAAVVMKSAIEGSSDPLLLNDGAYELATHNMEIPLAETSARKSVDLIETETAQINLDGVNTGSMRRMTLLFASWDTLGWIYFTEGKSDLAEPYLRAAWNNETDGVMGLHLGKVLEKRGDKEQAMKIYELALNAIKGVSDATTLNDLHASISDLEKQGVRHQSDHAENELQEQRTFRISSPAALKGSAIFLFQVSGAKIERVRFASGDESLRNQEGKLATLDLGAAVPKNSHALVIRSGVFFCSTQPTCELVLTPPNAAIIK